MPFHAATIAALLAIVAAQAVVIRYLALDPGFRIKTRAAGELFFACAFPLQRVGIAYGDIDHLGKINAALGSDTTSGHDRFNDLLRRVLRQLRRTDVALVYGGDEWRFVTRAGSIAGMCTGLQERMRALPLTEVERARLLAATGRDHLSITLAYTDHVGFLGRWHALTAVKLAVSQAKPKDGAGQRGAVLAV